MTTKTVEWKPYPPELLAKLDLFMKDFWLHTTQPLVSNRGRIFNDNVFIECRPFNGGIRINDIMTLYPRTGAGTAGLQFLIGLAEKHGVKLEGTAKAYHNSLEVIRDSQRLVEWYRKHGFVRLRGNKKDGYEIRYEPRNATEAERALVAWYRAELARRTQAVEAGTAPIDWVEPEHRITRSELVAKADALGIHLNPVAFTYRWEQLTKG